MRTFMTSAFGGFSPAFWVLWSSTLVNRLGTVVQPFMAIYLHTVLDLDLAETGLNLAVFGAGQAISQIVGGWLADQFGRLPTLTASLLATSGILVAFTAVNGPPTLTLLLFGLGLAMDAYRPASTALVSDIVPIEARARAYGLLFWSVNIGMAAAMLIGAGVQRIGAQWLFWCNALFTAGAAAVVLLARADLRGTGGQRQRSKELTRDARNSLKDFTLLAFCLIALVYGIVYHQAYITMPLAMASDGLGTTSYAIAAATNGVVIVLAQPLVGAGLTSRDHSRVFAGGMALLGIGFGLCAFATTTLGYAAAVVVWTAGEIAVICVGQSIIVALAPKRLRGWYSGLYGTAWGGAAAMAGPPLGTWLLGFGQGVLWGCCTAACLLAGLGQWRLGARIRRRSTAEESEPVPAVLDDPSPSGLPAREQGRNLA